MTARELTIEILKVLPYATGEVEKNEIESLLSAALAEEWNAGVFHTEGNQREREVRIRAEAFEEARKIVKQAMKDQDEYGLADGNWILKELKSRAGEGK